MRFDFKFLFLVFMAVSLASFAQEDEVEENHYVEDEDNPLQLNPESSNSEKKFKLKPERQNDPFGDGEDKPASAEIREDEEDADRYTMGSSSIITRCEKLLPIGKSLAGIMNSGKHRTPQATLNANVWEAAIQEALYRASTEIEVKLKDEGGDGLTPGEAKKIITNASNDLEKSKREIMECATIFRVLHFADYTDKTLRQNRFSASVASSINPMLICKADGIDTQDYHYCKKAISTYDISFVVKAVGGQAQGIAYQMKALGRQDDLSAKQMQGGLKMSDTVRSQANGVKDMAQVAGQNAMMDTAKASVLLALIKQMPDYEDLKKSCAQSAADAYFRDIENLFKRGQKNSQSQGGDSIKEKIKKLFSNAEENFKSDFPDIDVDSFTSAWGDPLEESGDDARTRCNRIVDQGNIQFIYNTDVKRLLQMEIVKAGTEAVSNLAIQKMLNDRADKIKEAADKMDSFKRPDFVPPSLADAIMSECLADPNAEGCPKNDFPVAQGFYNGGRITIGGNSNTPTTFGERLDLEEGEGSDGSSAGGIDRSNTPNRIGAAINGVNDDNSFERTIAPGAVKRGAGGGPGGSAGGGNVGKAAPPRGGGAGRNPNNKGNNFRAPSSKKMGFAQGGGYLKYTNGNRNGKRSTAKAANPFSKLFKKGKEKKGGVLNFRGPASQIGNKKGSIFDMITNRYTALTKEKRLLEYKIAK